MNHFDVEMVNLYIYQCNRMLKYNIEHKKHGKEKHGKIRLQEFVSMLNLQGLPTIFH
jgi:hypothetical protein